MPRVFAHQCLLLSFCWIASLRFFYSSWRAGSAYRRRDRFVARRASGAYGICSVFLIMRGPAPEIERTVRSIFGQSYPFLELFLIFPDDDAVCSALAQEFRAARTHAAVRLVPVLHRRGNCSRPHPRSGTRAALGQRALVRCRRGGVVLDQFAVEASMEFAGTGEVSALALRPGTQASSFFHRVLAPSMEYLFQMMRVVERRRAPRTRQMNLEAPYLLAQSRILRSHPSDQPDARHPERGRAGQSGVTRWKDFAPSMETVRAGSGGRPAWARGRTTRDLDRQSRAAVRGLMYRRDAGCPDSGGRTGIWLLRARGVFLEASISLCRPSAMR